MDGKCDLKLADDMPPTTLIGIGMNGSPQSQISETVDAKKVSAEKFSKIISGMLRREALPKKSSVLTEASCLGLETTGLKHLLTRKRGDGKGKEGVGLGLPLESGKTEA